MLARDPELVRLRLADKLTSIDDDIPIKTELTDEQIFAIAKTKALIKRLYTPLFTDVPYISFKEAQEKMNEIITTLSNPDFMKDTEKYNAYLTATEAARDYYTQVLDPLSEVVTNEHGEKVIRKHTPPVVYDEFFKQLEILNISKGRKGRLEILNVAVVERALNGMMRLMGISTEEDKQKSLWQKAFGGK
jgi:hypothetical protein